MVTINSPGHHLHNTGARVFFKHPDGRVGVQVVHSDKKGHVSNVTLKPTQFVKGVVDLEAEKKKNESLGEGTVGDKIKKVVSIYSAHRNLEDRASYKGDKAARAKHKEGAKRASALLAKMRAKQSAANADKPKPTEVHHDYSAAIAQDYKDQEKRRGIGHVRDSVEVIVDPNIEMLDELKTTTLQNYVRASSGDVINRQNIANRTGIKDKIIAKRNAGQKVAQRKLGVVSEATSARVRLANALARARQAEEAQRKRTEDMMKSNAANKQPVKEQQMKTLSAIVEESNQKIHPNALHVKQVSVDGKTKYHVHAVGKNFAHGIKVGERLSDSELDDFSEMGGKIKHVK